MKAEGGFRTAALALALFALLAAEGRAEGRATLYNFDGQASVVRHKRTIPAGLDMPMHDGDFIRTEAESFVDLALNGVVGVRVMAESECRIVNTNEGNMVLSSDAGSFLVNMKTLSAGSSFRIEVPTVTALVKDTKPGTQFLLRTKKTASGGSSATVISKKNTVYVLVGESSVTLSLLEGLAVDVPSGNVIPPPRLATEEEDAAAGRALSVYVAE